MGYDITVVMLDMLVLLSYPNPFGWQMHPLLRYISRSFLPIYTPVHKMCCNYMPFVDKLAADHDDRAEGKATDRRHWCSWSPLALPTIRSAHKASLFLCPTTGSAAYCKLACRCGGFWGNRGLVTADPALPHSSCRKLGRGYHLLACMSRPCREASSINRQTPPVFPSSD